MRVRYVNKNTALNPVARALAQKTLSNALVVHKIRLYMMTEGEPCSDYLDGIALMLATIGVASELDPKIGGDDVGVRILRGGMSACKAMLLTDKWDPTQAVSIERALDEAEALNKRVHPKFIAQANAMRNEVYMEVAKNAN